MGNNRFLVLGIKISATNITSLLETLSSYINVKEKAIIVMRDIHGLVLAQKSARIKKAHDAAALVVPDGMPLVWIGRLKGFKEIGRCYGPDLMLAVMKESAKNGYRHFFYGGDSGVSDRLKSEMEKRYPGVKIVGTYSPPFRPLNKSEELELETLVDKTKPDIIWVGLGTPKQELFMHEYLEILNTRLMIGVGAAFDFHTDRIKQAPVWMQRSGFEWFYRIIQEPGRLFQRYLFVIPKFIFLYLLEIFKIKRFDTP